MRVILFGATGMVGQGVLRECLLAADVDAVLSVGRNPSGQTHEKLRDLVLPDLCDYSAVADQLVGYDACFFCLGVSSAGMSEADYRRITYDIAVAAANALVAKSPQATFVFVSGAHTDANSKTMWSRVKGETENAILALPFKAKCCFRPGFIEPGPGIKSRTKLYNTLYFFMRPLVPLIKVLFPHNVTTGERVGKAMLNVARKGPPKPILESDDINLASN